LNKRFSQMRKSGVAEAGALAILRNGGAKK
jgi:hypothetical protein